MILRPSPRTRYRVLVIAEAANPEWASVPLIGWNLSQALAKVADTHLVTHVRNRTAILKEGLVEGRDFTAIDNEQVAAPLYKLADKLRGGAGKGWTMSTAFSSIAYYSFEAQLWRQFRDRLISGEFDIVHRITPLSPTSQSLIAKRLAKIRVPFVIGPLNGGLPWPKSFRSRQLAEHEWLSSLRGLFRLMPAYRSTRRNSSAILVGSQFTYEQMPEAVKSKCFYIPENGVDLDSLGTEQARVPVFPLRAAFVGRLVPYKGADILLEAAKDSLLAGKLELHIIGDGPERLSLERLARELNVERAATFYGWLPHEAVQKKLQTCDFLALPSIREFGGGVVIEAMALGVTPIVANYGGPAELVDDATGVRVAFTDKSSLVDGFRKAIARTLEAPEMLLKTGPAARRKVGEKLTWDAKAGQILQIYNSVMTGSKLQNVVKF
jgi:glycosyltransferase involved in cell wall biosynthesis